MYVARLSSCNTKQLTTVATEVGRLHKIAHPLIEQDPAPTSARETPGYRFVTGKCSEIERLYRSGQSIGKIAEELSVSKSTVSKNLASAGVPLRSKSEAAIIREKRSR